MTISDEERQRLLGEKEDTVVSSPKFKRSGVVASLLGMIAGLGMLVFVSSAVAAGAVLMTLEFDVIRPADGAREMSLVGIAIAAAVLLISTFVGGFVAGRIARYGGIRVGLGSSLWLALVLLLITGLTLFIGSVSAAFDGFGFADRLSRFDTASLRLGAAATGGGLFLLALVGGLIGGWLGQTGEEDTQRIVDIRDIEAAEAEPTEEVETKSREEPTSAQQRDIGSSQPEVIQPSADPTTRL